MATHLLYIEDLAAGMKFKGGPERVTEDDIIKFATEFDPQIFHKDPEGAKSSVFKGLAASGWHTVALTMRMLANGAAPFAGGVIGFGAEVSWPRPVRPGDELSVESEIVAITPSKSKPHQAVATVRTTTVNQDGEAVQILTSKNLVFKRGFAPGEKA